MSKKSPYPKSELKGYDLKLYSYYPMIPCKGTGGFSLGCRVENSPQHPSAVWKYYTEPEVKIFRLRLGDEEFVLLPKFNSKPWIQELTPTGVSAPIPVPEPRKEEKDEDEQ